jgi:hypothetical protein
MKVRVYRLSKPFTSKAVFIDIPGEPTFDPSHPGTYPGAEVELVEALPTPEAALEKYGQAALCGEGGTMYSANSDGSISIWRTTGRTSREIIYDTNDWR